MANWKEIKREQVPEGIVFLSLRQDQGQIIEVSYGSFDRDGPSPRTDPYKRVHDQSIGPGAVRYYQRQPSA